MRSDLLILLSFAALTACQSEREEIVDIEDANTVVAETVTKASAADLMSVPDVTAEWIDGCDEAFEEHITVFSEATDMYIEKDGKLVSLGSLQKGITIPWLTIYDMQATPISHRTGYNSESVAMWEKFRNSDVVEEGPWPSLETVATYSDLNLSAIPQSDLIFLKYSADWCAPCKAQSADLKTFRENNPDLEIAHVEIIADTKTLKGECPVKL